MDSFEEAAQGLKTELQRRHDAFLLAHADMLAAENRRYHMCQARLEIILRAGDTAGLEALRAEMVAGNQAVS